MKTEVGKTTRHTKKERILELFKSGTTNVELLAKIADASQSYVGSVLQEAGLMTGYFDLYTTTANPMNVYSKRFINKLGFKNEETSKRSVGELDKAYREYDEKRDRAGQHHALEMALVMFDRARWTGKRREAEIFRNWLVNHLDLTDDFDTPEPEFNFDEDLQENLNFDELETNAEVKR
ncbi:MAG: hypothetical protein H7Z37_06405 [Pyrinomonadaceae bacterium]|nr:hypothetical protein [Pyrinomonadaceae bacterium]